MMQSNDRGMERIRKRFNEADTRNNGELNRYEFLNLLKSFRVDIGPDELTHLMKQMDTDGGGTICFEEFISTGNDCLPCYIRIPHHCLLDIRPTSVIWKTNIFSPDQ